MWGWELLCAPTCCLTQRSAPPGTARVPGSIQVFSSYPGTIFSGDDFYILSSGLVSAACTPASPAGPAQPSHPHRLRWRPPLGTVTRHAGGTCGLRAASWSGCGTLWPTGWPAAVLSGPVSSSASTVAREWSWGGGRNIPFSERPPKDIVSSCRYNNQWMLVDYKAFSPGQAAPQQGLLTVLEQIP